MKKRTLMMGASALALSMASISAMAEDMGDANIEDNSLDASVWAGIGYHENLMVPELDLVTDLNGFAGHVNAAVNVKTSLLPFVKVGLGYDLNAKRFLDSTTILLSQYGIDDDVTDYGGDSIDFDYTRHYLSGTVNVDAGFVDLGLNAGYTLFNLGGSEAYTFTSLSPNFTKTLLLDTLYVRGSYTYTDKDFTVEPLRSGSQDAFGLEAFVFLTEQNKVGLGVFKIDETTDSGLYDYSGYKLTAEASVSLPILTLFGDIHYEDRDYDNQIVDDASELRSETRLTARAGAEFTLFPMVKLRPEASITKIDSNLEAISATDKSIMVSIGISF